MQSLDEYTQEALTLWMDRDAPHAEQLLHATLGVFGELKELSDALVARDPDRAIDELGDVLYYTCILGHLEDDTSPLFPAPKLFSMPHTGSQHTIGTVRRDVIYLIMSRIYEIYSNELQYVKKLYFRDKYDGPRFAFSECIEAIRPILGILRTSFGEVANLNINKLQDRYARAN